MVMKNKYVDQEITAYILNKKSIISIDSFLDQNKSEWISKCRKPTTFREFLQYLSNPFFDQNKIVILAFSETIWLKPFVVYK